MIITMNLIMLLIPKLLAARIPLNRLEKRMPNPGTIGRTTLARTVDNADTGIWSHVGAAAPKLTTSKAPEQLRKLEGYLSALPEDTPISKHLALMQKVKTRSYGGFQGQHASNMIAENILNKDDALYEAMRRVSNSNNFWDKSLWFAIAKNIKSARPKGGPKLDRLKEIRQWEKSYVEDSKAELKKLKAYLPYRPTDFTFDPVKDLDFMKRVRINSFGQSFGPEASHIIAESILDKNTALFLANARAGQATNFGDEKLWSEIAKDIRNSMK